MNKFGVKITSIIGACFIAVGAICLLIAKLIGGASSFIYPIGAKNCVVSADNCITEITELGPFTDLSIDTTSIDIEVVKGDSYVFEMCAPEELRPTVTEKNGKVIIQQPRDVANIKVIGKNSPYYKVTIPTEDIINADLDATSGKITVSDVNANCNIDVTSGLADVSGVTSKELSINSSSGANVISNCRIDKIALDSTSGARDFTNVKADTIKIDSTSGSTVGEAVTANDIKIHTTSGSTDLKLIGEASDYDYDVESLSGSINIDGMKCGHEFEVQNGSGKKISIDATSGSINIEF